MYVVDSYWTDYSFVLVLSERQDMDGRIETMEFTSEEEAREYGYNF